MRVNFIIPNRRLTGGLRVNYIYANYLANKGHDVCFYLPAFTYYTKEIGIPLWIKSSFGNMIKKERWFDCHFPVRVVPSISDQFIRDADAVIASSWQTAVDVDRLNIRKGRKYYFIQGDETFYEDKETVLNTYGLDLRIITITSHLKEKILPYNHDVHVVYNGLDDSEFLYTEKKRNNELCVMVLFHEAPYKGTEEALSIIEEAFNRGLNITPIIYGRRITKKFPENYIVAENPKREDLIKLFRHADIYLFTSFLDAWGLPVVEAMSNKCAVIGRNIGALEELYNGNNAVIASEKDEFIEAIQYLNNNRDRLYSIQDEGYKTVQGLSWEKSAQTFEKIISTQNE